MAQKKGSKPAPKAKKRADKQTMAKRQIIAVVLFAAAVLMFCILLIKGQNVWTFMHNSLFGLFGIAAYALPIIIGYIAVMTAINRTDRPASFAAVMSCVFLLFLCASIDIFAHSIGTMNFWKYIGEAFKDGELIRGGGFFGAVIGYPMMYLFSPIGSRIITILLLFVFIMLLTRTTLISLYDKVSKPVRAVRERADRRAEAAEGDESEPQHPVTVKNKKQTSSIEDYDDIPLINQKKRRGLFKSKNKNSNGAKFNIDVPLGVPNELSAEGDTSVGADSSAADGGSNPRRDRLVEVYAGEDGSAQTGYASYESDAAGAAEKASAAKTAANADAAQPAGAVSEPKAEKTAKPAAKKRRGAMAQSVDDLPATGITVEVDADYKFPPLSLLSEPVNHNAGAAESETRAKAELLVNTLKSFGVETRLVGISQGPSVTRYELQPAAGVKISKITGLANDIALNLASAGVRIEAPIPNKSAVGIEVPNKNRSSVGIRALLESAVYRNSKSKLCCVLGKDITGEIISMDLAKMPHLLVAGTTGSGKSVCLNSMIISMLYKASPDEVKLIMIDPKAVEFAAYNGIPHLLVPVVTNPQKAAGALGWAVNEMLKRYQRFSAHSVRNITGYNELCKLDDSLEFMPHIVIFIDELSDLMMAAPNEVEDSICRLAQMARAAGMHMVIATQSPRVDVITGLIKANIPSRIALTVSNAMDSRVIIDQAGAERLIGMGDMLYFPVGMNKPLRVQGCWVSDDEVNAVVDFLKNHGEETEYDEEIISEMERQAAADKKNAAGGESEESGGDERLTEAVEIVCREGQASTSFLQRKLKLGYARAARIMDEMEENGVIGPFEGSKPRKVLITYNQWLEKIGGGAAQQTLSDAVGADYGADDGYADDESPAAVGDFDDNEEADDTPPFDID